MAQPAITIITCSYNKPKFIEEAISSVLQQTYSNFEYIILENSTDGITRDIVHNNKDSKIRIIDLEIPKRQRQKVYIESHLKNMYSPQARGVFIMYLADDDVLMPTCFEEHIKEFESNTNQQVNFHDWKIVYVGSTKPEQIIGVNNHQYGLNTRRRPGRRVDGGAVMFKRELLNQLTQPYFKLRWKDAHISEALFLNKLGQLATFYPINKILHTKRITELSTHGFVDSQGTLSAFRPGDRANSI